jgi:hypothetical protein
MKAGRPGEVEPGFFMCRRIGCAHEDNVNPLLREIRRISLYPTYSQIASRYGNKQLRLLCSLDDRTDPESALWSAPSDGREQGNGGTRGSLASSSRRQGKLGAVLGRGWLFFLRPALIELAYRHINLPVLYLNGAYKQLI